MGDLYQRDLVERGKKNSRYIPSGTQFCFTKYKGFMAINVHLKDVHFNFALKGTFIDLAVA